MRVLGLAAALIALSLAGCAGSDDGDPLTREDALAAGMGVVRGLLVDDRFRPLHLTDEPVTEFQAEGFILVQETGDELRTTADGEFETPPLDPGAYTLRFAVGGHETVPQTVSVRAGDVTELSVVARRVASTTDQILQTEFSIFIPCTLAFVVSPMQWDCIPDESGDTTRFAFRMEDENLQAGATFLLTEVLLNKEAGQALQGTYMMQIEGNSSAEGDGVTSYNYVSKFIKDGKYDRVLLERGVQSEYQEDPLLTYATWETTDYVRWRFWGQGYFQPELAGALNPVLEPYWSVGYGVGLQVGTKATVLASMFFTEDRAVAEGFCGLCGDLT